jgi:uncharacterized phosphosugar-binding protein
MDSEQHRLLVDLIKELKNNAVSVVWNNGFDSVIFIDRSIDGKKSLNDIIKEVVHDKDTEGNPSI